MNLLKKIYSLSRNYGSKIKYNLFEDHIDSSASKLKLLRQTSDAEVREFLSNCTPWIDSPIIPSSVDFRHYCTFGVMDDTQDVCGLIVETRDIPSLDLVIHRYASAISRPLRVFCTRTNLQRVLDVLELNELVKLCGCIDVFVLECQELDAISYNSLFIDIKFWQCIPDTYKSVLVFQTDSLFFNDSKYSLSDFIGFDYIGAELDSRVRPTGLILNGGVGGLSLRNLALSRKAVNLYSHIPWEGGEDDFFAFYIELLGGKVASRRYMRMFCSQFSYSADSFAVHKPKDMDKKGLARLVKREPMILKLAGME